MQFQIRKCWIGVNGPAPRNRAECVKRHNPSCNSWWQGEHCAFQERIQTLVVMFWFSTKCFDRKNWTKNNPIIFTWMAEPLQTKKPNPLSPFTIYSKSSNCCPCLSKRKIQMWDPTKAKSSFPDQADRCFRCSDRISWSYTKPPTNHTIRLRQLLLKALEDAASLNALIAPINLIMRRRFSFSCRGTWRSSIPT